MAVSLCRIFILLILLSAADSFCSIEFFTVFERQRTAQAAEKDEEELFLVAQKAFDDGFYDIAKRYLEQFFENYPLAEKKIKARLLLGQCYFFQNQYLKAFQIFEELDSQDSMKDAIIFWLGETYFKGGDYKKARGYYQKLIAEYPASAYLAQAYYSLAWTFFEQDDYQLASDNFTHMVNHFPDHALVEDAYFKLGECAHHLGDYEKAIEFFTKYAGQFLHSPKQAEVYFYTGEAYYYLQDYLNAVTYYAKTADMSADNELRLMANISLGWCYIKLEKYSLAEKYLNQAESLSTQFNIPSDDIYLAKATLYTELGEYLQALDAYTYIIENFAQSPRIIEARIGKANIDYVLKNYKNAIEGYQWFIKNYSETNERPDLIEKAYYGLAWTHLKSGNIDLAIQTFEAIMNKMENKIVKLSALTQIGDAYHELNEFDKALSIYDKILREHPGSIYADYAQFQQGLCLLKLNKTDAATLSFQSLKANYPQSKYLTDVEYYLAVASFKKEDWTQAKAHVDVFLEKTKPHNILYSEALYIAATSNFHAKNYPEALKLFQQILDNDTGKKSLRQIADLFIAKCFYHQGKIKEALIKFNAVIDIYPQTEVAQEAYLQLGDHYLEQKMFPQAIHYYESFLKNFPGSEKINIVYYELGQTYQAKGEIDKAVQYYHRVQKTPSNTAIYAKARLLIADVFSLENDTQTAVDSYLKIAESVPEFKRDALIKIANVYERERDYLKAVSFYQQALLAERAQSEIGNAQIQFALGDLHEILNEPDLAVENYLKIPYLFPDEKGWIIKAYLRVARIFEDTERWEEAQKTYNKIMDIDGPEAKYAKERIEWIKNNAPSDARR